MISKFLYKSYWYFLNSDQLQISTCGWAEYKSSVLNSQELANIIFNTLSSSSDDFNNLVTNLNGNFTLIVTSPEQTLIATDRMRAYPVVYFLSDDRNLIITDSLEKYCIENSVRFEFDDDVLEQYLCSDYVVGPFTVFKNVFSTQSGEIVKFKQSDNSVQRLQYFSWAPKMTNDETKRDLIEEARILDEVFKRVFNRMINSAPHVNNWIIPLSGGYDSRVIVNYLYKKNISNVICYSYGLKDNIQSKISREVAEALGYRWYFIDYPQWMGRLHKDNLIEPYVEYAFNGSSVAHLQDFPAVYALKEMGILQQNDVFVPGHALEVLAGNHLDNSMQDCNTINSTIPILKKHFSGFGYYTKVRSNVMNHINEIVSDYKVSPMQICECFDWKERQTKFIANSVRCYEFFGFGWRIPEWDLELFNYWAEIGFNYRLKRIMFKEIFKYYLSVDQIKQIPFANDILENNRVPFKTKLINQIPLSIKKILKGLGMGQSSFIPGEGYHLIYNNLDETLSEYLESFSLPQSLKKYLKSYPKNQKIAHLPINSITTLSNIRRIHTYIDQVG